ncbi:NADH dehydrogenase [Chryseotalea sanaruensis]|uniref:NADH-quinone oxidoreductase subunit A n=1 Tax=Chryseotalea sanaruensis TaxID=2482724 RepID=A0A401UBK7_9BACT|nr:NADH-quinone oxidoreductase subunit A [Chryseotalea sanaruensis]GCC52252.1 NADH dehydrogenase [Chryseotalea sanaruensis]
MNTSNSYLSEFSTVLLFIIGGITFLSFTFLISRLLRPHRPNTEKLSSYESGEQAVSSAWPQFNIRFYVVAILFLLFEVELIFLFPWASVFTDKALIEASNGTWAWFTLFEVVTFVLVLVVGLVYAWAKGYFNWTGDKSQVSDIKSPVPSQLYEQINERYKTK